jgi:hypothetical protein
MDNISKISAAIGFLLSQSLLISVLIAYWVRCRSAGHHEAVIIVGDPTPLINHADDKCLSAGEIAAHGMAYWQSHLLASRNQTEHDEALANFRLAQEALAASVGGHVPEVAKDPASYGVDHVTKNLPKNVISMAERGAANDRVLHG